MLDFEDDVCCELDKTGDLMPRVASGEPTLEEDGENEVDDDDDEWWGSGGARMRGVVKGMKADDDDDGLRLGDTRDGWRGGDELSSFIRF